MLQQSRLPILYLSEMEKEWEYNEAVHQLPTDFKKSYNSVT
jgi:hypothetical protein